MDSALCVPYRSKDIVRVPRFVVAIGRAMPLR